MELDVISKTVSTCRICDGTDIAKVLDLGEQPPANSLRASLNEQAPQPVPLVLCRCRICGTAQLSETVSPDYLFKDYVWVTGTSQVARDYSKVFCERMEEHCRPGTLSVVEVASNDGTFLSRFKDRGHKVLGIDPAENLVALARANGIPTMAAFFGMAIAEQVRSDQGPADVVFARNVVPHVADVRDVAGGMAHLLSDDGVAVVEFHHAGVILDELHYDSIYHEHLFYFALCNLELLFGRFGLTLFDVDRSPISGGSVVAYFSKRPRSTTADLLRLLDQEQKSGIREAAPWMEFARKSSEHAAELRSLVLADLEAGRKVIGYGASARSSTLLNFCGIDHRHLSVVADQNPLKHGRFTPGTNIPIVSPNKAFKENPDTVMLLGWNFRDEILHHIRREFGWSGRVILPLPGPPSVVSFE
jgi:hypothetical protein